MTTHRKMLDRAPEQTQEQIDFQKERLKEARKACWIEYTPKTAWLCVKIPGGTADNKYIAIDLGSFEIYNGSIDSLGAFTTAIERLR